MLSAICFNLDQSKILSSDNRLNHLSSTNVNVFNFDRSTYFPLSLHHTILTFPTMFSTHPKTNFDLLVTFILLSAIAFNLG